MKNLYRVREQSTHLPGRERGAGWEGGALSAPTGTDSGGLPLLRPTRTGPGSLGAHDQQASLGIIGRGVVEESTVFGVAQWGRVLFSPGMFQGLCPWDSG